MNHRIMPASALFACALLVSNGARAQTCVLNESQFIPAPQTGANFDNEFGSATAVQGDRALVAAIGNDQFGTNAGTVYALVHNEGQWNLTQTIASPDASAQDQFGASIAISGNWAIIGAPQEDPSGSNNCGVAYAYLWNGSEWVFHNRLIPTDLSANKQFARSVGIDGDVVVASAVGDIAGGNSAAGAAYVFRYNGSAWIQEQKLMEAAPAPLRRFGHHVAVQGNTALVTALPSGTNPANTEGVYVFQFNGSAWVQTQRVQSPIWPAYEEFGANVRISGNTFAASAAPATGAAGSVRIYELTRGVWTLAQTIVAPAATPDGRFGIAFDLRGDRLVVSAPFRNAPTYPSEVPSTQAGLGFLFHRTSGQWTLHHALRSRPRWNFNTFAFDNDWDWLGTSVAMTDDLILLGGPTRNNLNEYGFIASYPTSVPDCDGNGVPDGCESDCNHDSIADVCEIQTTPAMDCDENGQPDSCQKPADYLLDGGMGSFIVTAAPSATIDFLWLNQFIVRPGGQRITHIGLPWTLYTQTGTPLTLLIYDDPNNDGDPSDAVLLTSAPVVSAEPPNGVHPLAMFTLYPVPLTHVGEVGDSFFIGAVMTIHDGGGAAMVQSGPNAGQRSWRATAPGAAINIQSPAANPTFGPYSLGYFILRGFGLDCNGNGVWDDCDINGGFSLDANNNGIPDECDDTCPADAVRSGDVNVSDLLAVISAWGPCPAFPNYCPADINGDLHVNVSDLLAVISAWGACP